MKKLLESFKNPDRRYAIYPIIHHNIASKDTACRYDKCWFAGVVGNVDYTFSFPDDESSWQECEEGFREYVKRGMKTWIYDEKGYPSGSARGYVTEMHPEYIAKGLYCFNYWRVITGPCQYRADISDEKLWRAALIPTNEKEDAVDITDSLSQNGVLHIDVPEGSWYLFTMTIRRLFDGTHAAESWSEPRNYISLSDKEATKAFIECTHEKYRERLSDEFGKGILAMFTDEPSLISWNITQGVYPILPWLESYPEDFEKKYGYDFMHACIAVVKNMGRDVVKRRCDFWEFIADTVANGFFGTIGKWCHENGLKSSGHFLDEECLQSHVFCYGSFFRSMKRLDWPGIDQLSSEPEALMKTTCIPIARFIASFADINGEREVFTEFSDIATSSQGKVLGLDKYYASLNWHLAMGVNNFTSYYSWTGISDEEIYDLNHYTARAGYLLRQGRRDSKIAIFYPEASMWSAYTPSVETRARATSGKIVEVENAFIKASWTLLEAQTDFDYIDADIMCKADIKNGMLCFNDRTYSAVVLPGVYVLEDKAFEKLTALAEGGIKVFFCGDKPCISRESGVKSAHTEKIEQLILDGKMHYSETDSFAKLIEEKLSDRDRTIRISGDTSKILSHTRLTEDGKEIVFIANMGEEDFEGNLTTLFEYDKAFELSAKTGDVTEINEKNISLTIPKGQAKTYLFEKK